MNTAEKHHFQAEIQQLLDIVIHSLYTDKEVFVRELISNAADACERLRFLQASGQKDVFQPETPLAITVTTDEKANTLTISDTGVGMAHGDLVENLGTIAHSGTRAFLKALAENQRPDAKLIGQFGVGFYSAFMVARKVTVLSRSHLPTESGWRWTSEGAGGYDIEPAADLPRGTQIILELKEDAKNFTSPDSLEHIIKRYSNFVQFPIELNGKRLNAIQAIWARNKAEVKEDEYNEFYRYAGHDQEAPLYRLHFTADAPLSIQALLFVPAQNFESLGLARTESEVHLYCRKVLIESHAKGLLPEWLRFLKGVVDSEDLPLNISRERMQDSTLLQKINKAVTNRFLKFLDEQAGKDPAAYEKFYGQYHRFLKEGALHDYAHRAEIAKLLRYESSTLEKGKKTSLADYVKRMPAEQKEIYYVLGANREAAESSPYFEVFRARNFEVLFLYEPVDEFVMENLMDFEGKKLTPAEKAELDIAAPESKEGALSDEAAQALATWMKETLGKEIEEVRVSKRLVDSPAVVLERDKHMTSSMRQILRRLQRGEEEMKPLVHDLEINPRHPVLVRLEAMRQQDPDIAGKVAWQVLDNARMAAGLLEDPRPMLKRLNELMEQMLAAKPAKQ